MQQIKKVDQLLIDFIKYSLMYGALYVRFNGNSGKAKVKIPKYIEVCIAIPPKLFPERNSPSYRSSWRRLLKQQIIINEGDILLLNPSYVTYFKLGEPVIIPSKPYHIQTFEVQLKLPNRIWAVSSEFMEEQ